MKGPKVFYNLLCTKLVCLALKCLEEGGENWEKKILMKALFSFTSCYDSTTLLFLAALTFLLLKIKSQNCYSRLFFFFKSKNVLGSISLLKPNSVTLTNWHKNKRLFQDNSSEARHRSKAQLFRTAPYKLKLSDKDWETMINTSES